MKDILNKNYKPIQDRLECPLCENELTVGQILENCSISWPGEGDWIYLRCPICDEYSHVEAMTDLIRTGVLSGVPGPCFIVCSEKKLEQFDTYITEKAIECRFKEKRYIYFSSS